MSSVQIVKRDLPTGTRYYARYRDAAGKQRMRLAGQKKKDAEAFVTELRAELKAEREGRALPKVDTVTTLRAWALEWVEAVNVRDHTRKEYRRLLTASSGIVASYGDLPLAALTRSHVRTWMQERAAAGASRNTIRNALAPVRAALADALEDGRVRENAAALTSRRGRKSAVPGRAPMRVTAPAPELVARILEAASPRFRTVALLAASSGLRCGELYALRWSDLSDDARTLTVSRSNNRGAITETKTEAGERSVPVFPIARRALLEHRLASRFTDPDDLVFGDELGRPQYAPHSNDRDLQATFAKAGLPPRAFRFHALRHFAVSQLIEQGANIVLLSKIAGHATPDITLKVYSHLMPTGAADAADRYDPLGAAVNG